MSLAKEATSHCDRKDTVPSRSRSFLNWVRRALQNRALIIPTRKLVARPINEPWKQCVMNDSKCCASDPNSGARQSTSCESSRAESVTSSTVQQFSKTRSLSGVGLSDFLVFQRFTCRLVHRSSLRTTFSIKSLSAGVFFETKFGRQRANASRRSLFRRYSFPNTTSALL